MIYKENIFLQGVTVTTISKCARHCEYCLVKDFMVKNPNYELTFDQFKNFVLVSYKSGYFFDFIDISGGEPLHWQYLEEALLFLKEYPIAKESVIFSNGLEITENTIGSLIPIIKNLGRLEISTVNDNTTNIELAKKYFSTLTVLRIGDKRLFYKQPNKAYDISLPARCGVNAIGLVGDYVYVCANCHTHLVTFPEYDSQGLYSIVSDNYLDKIDIFNRLNKPYCALCISNANLAPYLDLVGNKIHAW